MNGQAAAALVAAAVAAACGIYVAVTARRAGRLQAPFACWAIGFGLFAVADLALAYGAAHGWDAASFRLYYLTGGILVVPYLAVGELLLVAPGRTITRLTVATLLWLTFASTAAVLAATVNETKLAAAGGTPPNSAMGGPWTTILAIALNSAGTVVLLVGSVASARRRHDWRPLLVAVGIGIVALGATATRFGSYGLFALTQAVGVTLMMLGLVLRRHR